MDNNNNKKYKGGVALILIGMLMALALSVAVAVNKEKAKGFIQTTANPPASDKCKRLRQCRKFITTGIVCGAVIVLATIQVIKNRRDI